MISPIKESNSLPSPMGEKQNAVFMLHKDFPCDEIRAYNRNLEAFSSDYLRLVEVENMLHNTYGSYANMLYINGNFPSHVFSSKKLDEQAIYIAGFCVFPSYMNFLNSPQPPKDGLFVGFIGNTRVDQFTQLQYGIPESFGVIPFRHIVEVPYAFHTRLAGKTPLTSPMGAKNLKLIPELNPRASGLYGLEELRDFLLHPTTLKEAQTVVQRGLQKDVANSKLRRFVKPLAL